MCVHVGISVCALVHVRVRACVSACFTAHMCVLTFLIPSAEDEERSEHRNSGGRRKLFDPWSRKAGGQ